MEKRYFLNKGTVVRWWPTVLSSIVMRKYNMKLAEIINADEKDEIILDAGVGTGLLAIRMLKEAPCVVGLDLSSELISICAKNSKKRIALVLGDIKHGIQKNVIFLESKEHRTAIQTCQLVAMSR